MSGFISSLLIQVGIRSPDLPPPPTIRAEHPNEPTESDHRFTSQPDRHCKHKLSGDAGTGSLHSPPFFTTLPKEMDTRGLPGTQSVTHSAPGSIRNIATDGLLDANTDVSPRSVDSMDSDSHPHEAIMHHAPHETPSAVPLEDAQRPTNNAFDLEGVVQSSLPEDDGMGVLRNKIIAIRDLQLANPEKSTDGS